MNWSFATINNKLAEVSFEKKKERVEILGHCYVQKEEYKTKKELKMIDQDSVAFRFLYRKGKYKRLPALIS